MEATTVELRSLFDTDVRYLVPIFQRNYKWDEKEHWKPLWDDIRSVSEDILEHGAGADIVDHYLGAIVCEQEASVGLDAKAVSVIDGQQRLTTLALFIGAAHSVCVYRELSSYVELLAPMVENKPAVTAGRLEHTYKVWPNPADRAGFVAAMKGEEGESRPQRAMEFFKKQVATWLEVGIEDDPYDDQAYTPDQRMLALITAVLRYIKIVKIDLKPNDNAQLIFETLNGRGERLTDADLVRNALFRQADDDHIDVEALYSQYWKPFDDVRWSRPISHGRHQKDRLTLFVNQWLSLKVLGEVPASSLFKEYRTYVKNSRLSADVLAKDLADFAKVFDSFDGFTVNSREWWFFRRLNEMDLTTVQPVLLYLFSQPASALDATRRTRALDAIESFLVRRLVTRSSTRGYGLLFVDVLKAAASGDPGTADERIINFLMSNTAETDEWPTDEKLQNAVLNTNIYKLKQSRLKLILEAIDVARSNTGNTETISLGHSLWIEHLLPQSWRTEPAWALPPGLPDPSQSALERDHKLHTLGNLTLTTSKLDISLSNKPWPEKLDQLELHTSLQLNRDLIAAAPTSWDESRIADRGKQMAADIIRIWPYGTHLYPSASSRRT